MLKAESQKDYIGGIGEIKAIFFSKLQSHEEKIQASKEGKKNINHPSHENKSQNTINSNTSNFQTQVPSQNFFSNNPSKFFYSQPFQSYQPPNLPQFDQTFIPSWNQPFVPYATKSSNENENIVYLLSKWKEDFDDKFFSLDKHMTKTQNIVDGRVHDVIALKNQKENKQRVGGSQRSRGALSNRGTRGMSKVVGCHIIICYLNFFVIK